MSDIDHLFQALSEQDKNTLLSFAKFLAMGGGLSAGVSMGRKEALTEMSTAALAEVTPDVPEEISEPKEISRPEEENVINALKRLSATYPMLDKQALFKKTADLVTMTMMGTRDLKESIDELEQIFAESYEALKGKHSK